MSLTGESGFNMTRTMAKRLAGWWGFELWYDKALRLWVLQRNGYTEIENAGGAYIAPGVLDDISPSTFIQQYLRQPIGEGAS